MSDIDPQVRRVGPGEVIINPEQIELFRSAVGPFLSDMRKLHKATIAAMPTAAHKESFDVRMLLRGDAEVMSGFIGRSSEPIEFEERVGYNQSTETIQRQGKLDPGAPFLFDSITFFTYRLPGDTRTVIGGEAKGLESKIIGNHYSYAVYLIPDIEKAEIGVGDLTEQIVIPEPPNVRYQRPIVLNRTVLKEKSQGMVPQPAFT